MNIDTSLPVRAEFLNNRAKTARASKVAQATKVSAGSAAPPVRPPKMNPKAAAAAAQRRMANKPKKAAKTKKFKGKYAGPDKYKGIIPPHLRSKYKGKYFGRERYKGAANPFGG